MVIVVIILRLLQIAGDSHLYSYWGVSINLNNGGANPSGNAGNARIANTASFTINQKPVGGGAGSAFTNLFTVLQSGNVGIGTTTPSTALYVSGNTILNNAATCNSTLNVIGNIIGSGTALTNLNYNAISNPPNLSSYLPLAGGTMTASIIMTGNSTAMYFTGGGAALGEAGGAGAFSSSAATNDLILRSRTGNNLILQCGGNGGAIIIKSSNNTIITGATTCSSTLNTVGAITCSTLTASTGNNYLSGLRINGGDTANTIYQATGYMGINTNTTNINLGMNTYGVKVNITPTSTTLYTNTTISASTPSLNIKSSSEADSAILYLATPYTSGSALKCAIIAQGQTSFSRSKLHFCLDGTADNTYPTYNASVSNSRMTIDYNGNVGINTTSTGRSIIKCFVQLQDVQLHPDGQSLAVSHVLRLTQMFLLAWCQWL
jgi:hypothetical protein